MALHASFVMSAPITQALLSVSDKTGLVEFARGLARPRRRAPVDRRHGEGARGSRACRHRDRRLHRLSRDARRPRQDAASEGARRHPRAARRPRACRGARSARASRRSTSSSSTSIRFARPSRRPAARSTTRSRTSTSAARRWCAPRRRTGSTSGVVVDPADYDALLAELARSGNALSAATRFALAQKAFSHTAVLRRRDLELADRARPRWRGRARFPTASTCRRSRCRICATARTRTSRPPSIGTRRPRRARSRPTGSCRARSCRTTTSRIRDAAWECVKIARVCRSGGVRHRQARESLRRRGRGHAARRLPECVRDRPGVGVRRHHRVQPADRRGDARGRVRAIPRSADRAGLHGGRAQGDRAEEERARAGGRRCPPSRRRRSAT